MSMNHGLKSEVKSKLQNAQMRIKPIKQQPTDRNFRIINKNNDFKLQRKNLRIISKWIVGFSEPSNDRILHKFNQNTKTKGKRRN